MSDRRQVWETLSNLLARVEASMETPPTKDERAPSDDARALSDAALEKLEKELRRLGKAQFKANVLAEDQGTRWEQALASVEAAQEQRDQLQDQVVSERVAARERELLETVLPAVDGLENAIASGRRYLKVRDLAANSLQASKSPPALKKGHSDGTHTPEQAALVSPADRAMLAGWLDGLRLVRERMLAILEAGEVTPIPTVGQPFDPYLHVAVGTTTEGDGPVGTIVAEERRGYRSPSGVLRYAEVIVYQPES